MCDVGAGNQTPSEEQKVLTTKPSLQLPTVASGDLFSIFLWLGNICVRHGISPE